MAPGSEITTGASTLFGQTICIGGAHHVKIYIYGIDLVTDTDGTTYIDYYSGAVIRDPGPVKPVPPPKNKPYYRALNPRKKSW